MRSSRTTALLLAASVAGCAAPAPPPAETPFARVLLERSEAQRPRDAVDAVVPDSPASMPPAKTRDDAWRGLVEAPPARTLELERIAADESALDTLLSVPVGRQDLTVLSALRSPAVRAAESGYRAARTAYPQSRDLEDLVALYRSYTRDLSTRIGPDRSRRMAATVAPSPNVDLLSGEMAHRAEAMAFEDLRRAVRDTVAHAERIHADAARLHEARTILREQLEFDAGLLAVLRARLESGEGSQAGYLAFEARVERLRTELAVLGDQEAAIRAAWNEILDRPVDASLCLDPAASDPLPPWAAAEEVLVVAEAQNPDLRSARLAAERSELALRLAETMTLPRFDLGGARLERERTGEAGLQRGAVFADPARGEMPRSDFGVREAQLHELRARRDAAAARVAAVRDMTGARVRAALFARDAADRRLRVQADEVVPRTRLSFESARGAYEGGRTTYLDVLDAARRLLDARLALADVRRDAAHADASLLDAVGVRVPARSSR